MAKSAGRHPVHNKIWIEQHIPHKGNMCLLDSVLDWSPDVIRCRASSHRLASNPLRLDGQLGAACGIEYAAQAMAIHGALLAPADTTPSHGYLAGVREAELFTDRLDNIEGDLEIEAERLSGDAQIILYRFSVRSSGGILLSGRATVMLDASAV